MRTALWRLDSLTDRLEATGPCRMWPRDNRTHGREREAADPDQAIRHKAALIHITQGPQPDQAGTAGSGRDSPDQHRPERADDEERAERHEGLPADPASQQEQ